MQYNSEDNSWSWWLKGIKSGFADVSEEAGNFFTKYENKGKNLTQIMSNVSNNNGLDNFIRQNKLADESLIKFLGNANYAEKTLDNYKLYLKDTGQATSAFAGFTKKASTALKSFAASMASMAATWLIFEAIGLVFKAVDNWIHKAEYSREALEEVTKELDGTKSELTTINDKIAEIQAKGKLELTDKVELQKLESERSILEDQVRLLELKKELAEKKSNKDAVDTVDNPMRGFGKKTKDGWTTSYGAVDIILDGTSRKSGQGSLTDAYKDLAEIEENIRNADQSDSQKLIKLYEKRSDIQADINEDKNTLTDVYSENLELLEQMTGDDPATQAAREKLEAQNQKIEQYIFSAEEIAQKNLTRFKEKFATNYNANLDLIQDDSNHKRSVNDTSPRKDAEGYGTIARSGVTEEGLDGLIAKNKELNQSFVDGKITTSEYFDNLSSEIEKINLDDVGKILDGGKGDNRKTDYIEETVANLAGQVSDALMYADQSFKAGETSVSDYIDTLDSGMEAQKKLLKSTYDLAEGENGLVKAVDESDLATKDAADSFNDLVKAQEGLDAVDEFADKMESYNEKLMQFVENDTTITDAILGDPELFNTHMDNVTDSLVNFANASEQNFDTVSQQLQDSLNVGQQKAEELIRSGGDAIQAQAGQNMDAVNKLTDNAMANTNGAVKNASQAIGGVLSALGQAISGFSYNIKATPYIEGDFDFTIEDGKPKLSLASFGFDISGSGSSSVSNLSKALSDAGTYFSNAGSNNSDSISSYGSNKGNKGDTTTNKPSGGGKSGGSGSGGGSNKNSAEDAAKKELEAFKESLDMRQKIIDKYKNSIDLTDFGLELADTNDFALRADLLNNKMSQVVSYGEAMREEFDRVAGTIPKTGEEADALASHLESLGNDMRSNIKTLRETQVAMQQLKIDSMTSVGNNYLKDLDDELDNIEKRIEMLGKDDKENYKYVNDILSMKSLLPTRSGTKDGLSKRRNADQGIIESEQETQDTLNDILEEQIKKNDKLREDERQRLLENMETMRQETTLKLQASQIDYDAHSKQIQTITDEFTNYVTTAVNNMNLVIPKPDTTKFTDAAKDIKDALNEIDVLLGGTPGAYAEGTPAGNAQASKLGIAGENYRPEILIDKKTGETTYINTPTLIDTTKTDVVGEKATSKLPKFAKGTLGDDITSAPHFAKKMYDGLANVIAGAKGYGAVAAARKYLGLPYVWGGTDGEGVDCSGLTYLAWKLMGVDIGRTTYQQYPNTARISRDQLRPGDLVFTNFGADDKEGPGHVGMYIGNGQVIESPSTGDVVKITSNLGRWTDFGRPTYASGTPDGNAQASRYGIAGENFKPEILIDKATGKTTYIDKPTVFDLSKTDVVGEKETANIPKFATGTPVADTAIRAIIKEQCDKYGVPYEIALAVLDQEMGNKITLGKNPDGKSYSHTSWQLYDYGVWGGVSSEDKAFIENAAKTGENFNEAFGKATGYAMNYLAQNYKRTGSWKGAVGAYNGSGINGAYANSVINRANSKAFQDVANAMKSLTGAITDNTQAIKELSEEEKEIARIQTAVNNYMGDIDEATSHSRAQQYEILNDNSLDDSEKQYLLYSVAKPAGEEGQRIARDAYSTLLQEFLEYDRAVQEGLKDYSSETYEAYYDGLSELEDRVYDFKDQIESIFDSIMSNLENELSKIDDYIDDRNTYNDWAEYGDSEFRATLRQIAEIDKMYNNGGFAGREEEYKQRRNEYEKSAYSLGVDKLITAIDNEVSAYEEMQDEVKRELEFESSQYASLHTLLQSHFNVINSIKQAQHEINKELTTSKAMYEYLNKDTRKLLFNQEDYNVLNKKLVSIQRQALRLQNDYKSAISRASEENIAKITSQYQMQYDLLMKSYEIAKADLEVAKKKQQLNNVLKERNTRMFINGRWRWVASTEDVQNALTEYNDAKYQSEQARTSLSQQNELNSLQTKQDSIATEIAFIDTDIENFRKSFDSIQELIEGEQQTVADVLKELGSSDLPKFAELIDKCGLEISKLIYNVSGEILHDESYADDYMEQILNATNKEDILKLNKLRNEKIDFLHSDQTKLGDEDALSLWDTYHHDFTNDILNGNWTADNLEELYAINKKRNNKIDYLKSLGIKIDTKKFSDDDVLNMWIDYQHDYLDEILNANSKDEALAKNHLRNEKVDYFGLNTEKISDALIVEEWQKKEDSKNTGLIHIKNGSHLIPLDYSSIIPQDISINFNQDHMKNLSELLDIYKVNTGQLLTTLNATPLQSIDQSDHSISIEKLNINADSPDGQNFLNALRRVLPNH